MGGDRGRRKGGGGCRRVRGRSGGDAGALADRITKAIPIPTIGIGASAGCDGQILVMEDMLGLSPRVPKFVKMSGAVGAAIEGAIKEYAGEVRARTFPGEEHTYAVKPDAPGQKATAPGAKAGKA